MPKLVDREPDFVNPEGVKWWKENSVLDKHAKEALGEKASVWIVQTPDQAKYDIGEYLLLDGNDIIANCSGLEAMAYKIDFEMLRRK